MTRNTYNPPNDEYAVVSFKIGWSNVSIACFGLALMARFLLRYVPWRPQQIWMWQLVPVLTILALSLLGLFTGWLGFRFSSRRGAGKVGMFLNGVVLGIALLVFAAMYALLRVR